MENKQTPSKKRLLSIQEDKLIREFEYNQNERSLSRAPKKQFNLDLEIFKKNPAHKQASQRVLVSIKPRVPAIKTIYIAEKSRFHSRKGSEKSGSRSKLGIGDHSSFNTHFSDDGSNVISTTGCESDCEDKKSTTKTEKSLSEHSHGGETECESNSTCYPVEQLPSKLYNVKPRSAEKCYIYTQPQLTMNLPRIDDKLKKSKVSPFKVDIGTFIESPSSEETLSLSYHTLDKLHKRINHLERKILRQEMVFHSIDPKIPLSSSDEESKNAEMRAASAAGRPGCSYIQQYSHIPKTSAFQRYAHQTTHLSPSRTTTLEKEHNSEQYGRDLTAYDGITARGRRQCASVPCKRDDFPKVAAERVHKLRHKLNPVRDYRLMDTVHYLAQGEFAPRDDGIKLTPSREAVLSDIIYEDVCRTHWPNARLSRRAAERCSARCELQRLIDSLLRERVAHVERRRRRHYRIVKLNHRHENCRPMGKTGDIIVASHKKKDNNEEREIHISDHNAASAVMSYRHRDGQSTRKGHRSHEKLTYQELIPKRRFRQEECMPGPSCAVNSNREPTCCYHTSSPSSPKRLSKEPSPLKVTRGDATSEMTTTNMFPSKTQTNKKPRLIVKKESTSHKKFKKEEPNLEQYLVLPTLVIRTPSNVKRQKKFNALYHRILNLQMNNEESCQMTSDDVTRNSNLSPSINSNAIMKDIGVNINITLSDSEEQLQ